MRGTFFRPWLPVLLLLAVSLPLAGCSLFDDDDDNGCGISGDGLVPIEFVDYSGCILNGITVDLVEGSSPNVAVGQRFRARGSYTGQTPGRELVLTFLSSTSDNCTVHVSDSGSGSFDVVSMVTSEIGWLNPNLVEINSCHGQCESQCHLLVSPNQVIVRGQLTQLSGGGCPVVVTSGGHLYGLVGDTGAYTQGDQVCVRGSYVEQSICNLAFTVEISTIGPASECD